MNYHTDSTQNLLSYQLQAQFCTPKTKNILEQPWDSEKAGKVHYVNNPYDEPTLMVSTLAPFQEIDKVEVENPEY